MAKRLIVFTVLTSIGIAGRSAAAQEHLPKINPDGWTPSAACGQCHQAIHAVWQHSLHSKSWSNGVFQAGYRRAIGDYGPLIARQCLACHAPTVRHTKDYEVKESITAEGVTCDFCHSVSAVELRSKFDPIRLSVGKMKFGPMRHAQSPVHSVMASPLHGQSEFCAGCHEYRNANGVTVLGTYSEWKESEYAQRGRQCQHCHMPLVPGRVVALNVKEETPTSVNLHDISGSHNLDRVRQAITLKMKGSDWFRDRVWVSLEVANVGSGHCFPTGLPAHKAVLEVTLREKGSEIQRHEFRFEVVLLDQKGRPIAREHEMFVKSASIRSDTRLRPMEARPLIFSFRNVRAAEVEVNASLFYQYSTEMVAIKQGKERIEPVEMKFLVAFVQEKLRKPSR